VTTKKRTKKKYPKAMREMAMERLKSCVNVTGALVNKVVFEG
jgi:hypothetical protein